MMLQTFNETNIINKNTFQTLWSKGTHKILGAKTRAKQD